MVITQEKGKLIKLLKISVSAESPSKCSNYWEQAYEL